VDNEFVVLDSLFSRLSDGVCVTGPGGNLLYINPAAEQLLGLDACLPLCEALCGKLTCEGRVAAETCALRAAGHGERSVSFEGRYDPGDTFQWKDFSVRRIARARPLRVHCMELTTPLFDGIESEKHFSLIEDASAEEELKKRKDYWLRMLTHDMKAPMTNIYGVLRALEDMPSSQSLPQAESRFLQVALRNCRRMLEMLDLFLELARLDAQQMPVEAVDFDVADLLHKAAEEQELIAQARSISLVVSCPEKLTLRSDPKLVLRIVQNLLNNAAQYALERSTVRLNVTETPDAITLAVEDEGPGIDPEMVPLLFDRFQQAKARREGKFRGNGLGLSFCHEAVAALGGDISVASAPGKGTRFAVRLPKTFDSKGG
jgi:signal transduction histidine kinase